MPPGSLAAGTHAGSADTRATWYALQQIASSVFEPGGVAGLPYNIRSVSLAELREKLLYGGLFEFEAGRQLDQYRSEFIAQKGDLLKELRQSFWTATQPRFMSNGLRNLD
jgi:hypothetical protein